MKKNKNILPSLLSYIAILSLFTIAIYFFFFRAYFFSTTQTSSSNNNSNNQSNVNNLNKTINTDNADLELGYDPLVTVVPEDLQNAERKGKFFVSSLDPKTGANNAKVILFVWSNFKNEEARNFSETMNQLRSDYSEKDLAIIWKDLFNIEDDESNVLQAALASHCANEQDKFWQYHDLLFNNSDFSKENFINLSEKLELDREEFTTCFESNKPKALVENSYYFAKSQGFENNAPVVFINDKKIEDVNNIDNIKQIINNKIDSYE